MRNLFNALVIASAFALLVPDNRAQAVGAADFKPLGAVAAQSLLSLPAVSEQSSKDSPQQSPELSWLLALGFLGVVVSRRLRAD